MRRPGLKLAGAYIDGDKHEKLVKLAEDKGISLAELCRRIFDAGIADAEIPALQRPAYVPDTGGCKADCGHTEEEHIAFDLGLYDGEQGRVVPSIVLTDFGTRSAALLEAWHTGHSIGQKNRAEEEQP